MYKGLKNETKSIGKGKGFKKKENSLDYYISKSDMDLDGNTVTEESKRHQFLKENMKAAEVIPNKMTKSRETPNHFGYFKTRFGTIAVGVKKYKKDSPISFSIVPDDVQDSKGIPEKDENSADNYFGGEQKKGQKNFKFSEISFKYNPRTDEITKIKNDNDGVRDKEEELLYNCEKEEEKIDDYEEERDAISGSKYGVNKKIADMRDIQDEKEEDNKMFAKEIHDFLNGMKKNIIKKKVESDEANTRRRRIGIMKLSNSVVDEVNNMSAEEIRKRLEEIFEKEEELKNVFSVKEKRLDEMEKDELIKLFKAVEGKHDEINVSV